MMKPPFIQQEPTIFSSEFLRKRGNCCKSTCLHCPYGFTVKKLGIQFLDFTSETKNFVNHVCGELNLDESVLNQIEPGNIKIILLKDFVVGFFIKNHIIIQRLYLRPNFQDQDLSKELIESYFF